MTGIPVGAFTAKDSGGEETKSLRAATITGMVHPLREETSDLRSRDLQPGTGQQRITRSRL